MKKILAACLLLAVLPLFAGDIPQSIPERGKARLEALKKLYGRVRFTESCADFRVRIADFAPDIDVRMVTSAANSEARWQACSSAEDFSVRIVSSAEDFSIRFVESAEGVRYIP